MIPQPSPIFSFENLRTIFPEAPATSWRSDNPDEEVVVSFEKFKKSAPRLSESERAKPFTILAVGEFSTGGHTALRACQEALSKCFHRDVQVQAMEDPKLVDSWRQSPLEGEDWPQANATGLLDNIQNASALFPAKIDMCIVPFDLWPGDDWNYVFGLAHCGDGGLSVTSLWRLGDFDGHKSEEAILRAVKAVMDASFEGHLNGARVEITYGEEQEMEGAAEIAALVAPEDIVVVVDVTGYLTDVDIVIEKCSDPWLQKLVEQSFHGAPFSYEILDDCQDPISQIDETSVYKQATDRCLLVAIPCDGGDYNSHVVRCRPSSIRAASQALQLLFGQFVKQGRR